jgi:uncharacterized protein (DUF2252 family)
MAWDLSQTPTTRLRVQCCGDAHLANFGVFAAPDRRLVFDLNDFDEFAVRDVIAPVVGSGVDGTAYVGETRASSVLLM